MGETLAPVRTKRVLLSLTVVCAMGCQHMPWKQDTAYSTRPRLFRSDQAIPAPQAEKVARITPKQEADVQFAQARMLESDGDLDQAIAMYAEVVKRDKNRVDACHRLGILTCKQSRFDESNDWFKKALKASPTNPDICCDYGYGLYVQGRLDEAEKMLKTTADANPNHKRAHNNLGLVYAHSDRLELALDEFQQGGATAADAHSNVALALALDGDLVQAREFYARAIELDENCVAARNGLKKLEPALAKIDEAGITVVGGIE